MFSVFFRFWGSVQSCALVFLFYCALDLLAFPKLFLYISVVFSRLVLESFQDVLRTCIQTSIYNHSFLQCRLKISEVSSYFCFFWFCQEDCRLLSPVCWCGHLYFNNILSQDWNSFPATGLSLHSDLLSHMFGVQYLAFWCPPQCCCWTFLLSYKHKVLITFLSNIFMFQTIMIQCN